MKINLINLEDPIRKILASLLTELRSLDDQRDRENLTEQR